MMGSPMPKGALEEIYECGKELTTNMKKEWTTQILEAGTLWCRPGNAAAWTSSSEGAYPTIPREMRMEAQDSCRASPLLLS